MTQIWKLRKRKQMGKIRYWVLGTFDKNSKSLSCFLLPKQKATYLGTIEPLLVCFLLRRTCCALAGIMRYAKQICSDK